MLARDWSFELNKDIEVDKLKFFEFVEKNKSELFFKFDELMVDSVEL